MLSATPTLATARQDDAVLSQYRIVIDVFVVGTLCTLGIAGNLLSIVVLGRDRSIRRTTGFMLQMLAVADAVYLVTCLFFQTLNCVDERLADWLPAAVGRHWPYVEVYAWPMASVAQTAAVWLVVVLTADRFVAICRPLHAAHYSTITRVRRAVATVWMMAILYNLPRFFERVVIDVDVSADNSTVASQQVVTATSPATDALSVTSSPRTVVDGRRVAVNKTAMRDNPVYFLVYKTCLFFVVRFLIPFTALAFFNQRLIRAMRESDQIRRRSTRGVAAAGGKERQYTRTLVVVVVVFVVCELPDLTLRAWIALNHYAPAHVAFPRSRLLYVNTASNLLLTINSCINFVIYCFMGRRFRLILIRTLGCGGRQRCGRTFQDTRPTAVCVRHSHSRFTVNSFRSRRRRRRTV